ncbi:hypothetical protein [Oscillibacter sp.]|uniref:hypothetical protein n=1 Tax=Oscillibacter sp. TaxID=1945593 RepID=UPI002D80CE76|nr:hypothetical protein [Oscillibacter sp.]
MKLRIEEKTYEGTGTEILEQLRLTSFDPTEFPDSESYLWQLRSNFMRATDLECPLPEGSLERQARAMFALLAKAGALEVLENG